MSGMKSGGTRHVTLFDICKRAGVSSATVSRVINNSPLVVSATRTRVEKAIRDLGYHPSHAARTLARRRTDTIAAVFPEIASGYFAEVLAGIDASAAERRHHVITALSHGVEDEIRLISRFSLERRVDGLIVLALTAGLDAVIKETSRAGLPVVVIGRPIQGRRISSVIIDNEGGLARCVSHLAETGRRRIAIIQGPPENYDAKRRLEGARREADRVGVTIPSEWIWPGDFHEVGGRAAIERYWPRTGARPDAIIALNDEMAMGARSALAARGVRVPQDVALIGFDDLPVARHVGLTTVRNPMREIGAEAGRRILALAAGHSPSPAHCTMPVELVIRESTSTAP